MTRKLIVPRHVCDRLVSLILETPNGLETGVTLLGTTVPVPEAPAPRVNGMAAAPNSVDVVLAVVGPGRGATHEPAHYSGDEHYSNSMYETLQSAMPGIRWLGELHAHPHGMTWLSQGDLETVREILTGDDDTLHPAEFIAGVMQRKNGSVKIYPFHFTRECLKGSPMEIRIVSSQDDVVRQARLKGVQDDRPGICTESQGSGAAVAEAPRHCWLWQWGKRARGHVRTLWHRFIHFGRSRTARS